MLKLIKGNAYLLLLILLLTFLSYPVLAQGFGNTDGGWMVIRLSAFHEALRGGQFPVRFLERLNHGYGYPVTNFLYPLPFYLGEILHLIGLGFVSSVKVLFAASTIVGAVGMFLFVRKNLNDQAGFVAALTYSIFPYRLFDIYSRGSLGEVVALAVVPFVFYFSQRAVSTSKQTSLFAMALLALSLAALITAHNTLGFMFVLVVLPFWLLLWIQTKKILQLVISGLLGTMLSAFFWVPAILELSYTRAPMVEVANYWEYFLSGANFPTLLGLPTLLVVLGIVLVLFKGPTDKFSGGKQLFFFFVGITLVGIFLSTQFSWFLWQFPYLVHFVQFPWRFSAVVMFGVSILAGSLFSGRKVGAVAFLLIIFIGSWSLFQVNGTIQSDPYYATNDDTTTVKNEYMPRWVRSDPVERAQSLLTVVEGTGSVQGLEQVTMKTHGELQINKVYYPGTNVFVDGKKATINYEENGLVRVSLKEGTHQVTRSFSETPLRLIANVVSLLGLGVVSALLLLTYPKNRLGFIFKKRS